MHGLITAGILGRSRLRSFVSGGRPHQDRGYRRCSDRIRVSEHPAEVSSRIAVALVRAFGWN
jgi:hypothetical protein